MIKSQKHAAELMPKNEDELRILRARAVELAHHEVNTNEINGIAYIQFKLGQNEIYGISYQYAHEVLHHANMSKPPCTPDYIIGVINWRGNLIAVVDLGQFLHSSNLKYSTNEYIIIVTAADITIGIIADKIVGSGTYQPNLLALPLSSVNVANPEYILGLHQSITAILNVEAIISSLNHEIKKYMHIGDTYG